MDEARKTNALRGRAFIERYLSGKVIDIGAGADLVAPHAERFDRDEGDANVITRHRAAGILATDLAMAVSIVCGVGMARFRARGPKGSLGFWPAWSPKGVAPTRTLGQDILLGVLCYPLTIWTVYAADFMWIAPLLLNR